MKELRIMNPSQVYFYIENGIHPIRVECGKDNRLAFIYTKEETYELFGEWVKRNNWTKRV